jgi:hypothetical protein
MKKISEKYSIQIANDLESRFSAYRFVYKAYLQKGYATENASQLWLSVFDALPTTTTLIVTCNQTKAILGTMTMVFDSPIGLPSDEIFKSTNDTFRNSQQNLAEVVSLVLDASCRNDTCFLLGRIFNYFFYIAGYQLTGVNATDFLITINPRHENFYKKVALFERAADDVRFYKKVNNAPAVLLRANFDIIRANSSLANGSRQCCGQNSRIVYQHFHEEDEEEDVLAFIRYSVNPWTEHEFRYFLIEQTKLLEKATPHQLHYFQKIFPNVFAN